MQRRRVLQAIAAGAMLGVAGCTGDGTDSANGDTTPSPSPTPNPGSGGTGGGSAATPTPAATATPADETTPTPAPTDEPTATPADEETGDSEVPPLASLDVKFEDNYRFSVSVPELGEPITGAFDGGNFYSVVTSEGDAVTTYVVEGTTYVVVDGSCTQVPGSGGAAGGVDVDSLADADTVEQDITGEGSATPVPNGTATIDGEEMYVYELDDGGTSATYYVGVESRRLRRVQAQGVVIDYTDWGAAGAVTAPC